MILQQGLWLRINEIVWIQGLIRLINRPLSPPGWRQGGQGQRQGQGQGCVTLPESRAAGMAQGITRKQNAGQLRGPKPSSLGSKLSILPFGGLWSDEETWACRGFAVRWDREDGRINWED